jgi:DNA mismatch endonuclease, patch repair protein
MEKRLRVLLPGGAFANVSNSRSRTMSLIRAKDNGTTERALRMALVRAGERGWCLHCDLVGRPDFYFPKSKLAVFVDGCFWHGCGKCGHIPRTRSSFWQAKLDRNRERDRRTTRELRKRGMNVIRIWEHQLKTEKGVLRVLRSIQTMVRTK